MKRKREALVSFWSRDLAWIICVEVTYSVGRLNEGVVDSNDLDIGVLDSIAEDNTTDTAKSVDADLDHFD